MTAWTCGKLKRAGESRYAHLVRDPKDPQPPVPKGEAWARPILETSLGDWKAKIIALLADGEPRTFQKISAALASVPADSLLDLPPEVALFQLTTECVVEHTTKAPVFFRLKGGALRGDDKKAAVRAAETKKKPASKESNALWALAQRAVPRDKLEGSYGAVAASHGLRPYGYEVVIWFDPARMRELFEYVPVDPKKPRYTTTNREEQALIHAGIGAPALPPKEDAHAETAWRAEAAARARAKIPSVAPWAAHKSAEEILSAAKGNATAPAVVVLVNGSKNSIAAALWVLAHGRTDAQLWYEEATCKPPVTKAYLRAFAEQYDLRLRAKELPKFGPQTVIVTGERKGAPFEADIPPAVTLRPFAQKSDKDVWSWLDAAGVRPHPAYTLGVNMPCDQAALEDAAAREKPTSREKAIALAAVQSGSFPVELVLYDEGETRETHG